jgi:hypothetical protein
MLLGRDHHRRLPGPECVANEAAQFIQQEAIFSIELDDVTCVLVVGPMSYERGRCTICG